MVLPSGNSKAQNYTRAIKNKKGEPLRSPLLLSDTEQKSPIAEQTLHHCSVVYPA